MPSSQPKFQIAWLALPFLAAAIMIYGWPLASDQDLFIHLKLGQLIVEAGRILREDVFSYTAMGRPEEIHAWLSQVLFWAVFHHFGEIGLRVLNFILVAGVLTLCGAYAWKQTRRMGLVVMCMCLALVVHHEVQILRPLLFGELFFCVILFFFIDEPKPLSAAKISLLLALIALWANLHASVLGILPFLALYSGALFLEKRHEAKWPWPSLLLPGFAFFAIALNPQGFGLYSYGWEVVELGKRLEIGEWRSHSPFHWENGQFWMDFNGRSVLLYLGFAAFFAFLAMNKERLTLRRLYRIALIACLLLLPLFSFRHTAYLIYPLLALTIALGNIFRLRFETAGLGLASAGMLFAFHIAESPLSVPPIEKSTDFLAEAGITGNIFNHPSWGSYLVYRLYPKIKVAHTMRLQVHRVLLELELEQYEAAGGILLSEILEKYPETDLILLPSHLPLWAILNPAEWTIVFENNVAAIGMRKTSRNVDNFGRVAHYYRAHGIAFDPTRGIGAADLGPEMQEAPGWGKWPKRWVRETWEQRQKNYDELKKMPQPKKPESWAQTAPFYWKHLYY